LTSTREHQYNHHETLKNREELKMRIRNWLIGLLVFGFVLAIASSSWGVPRMINVQGRLTGFSLGDKIDFDIYDAQSGGALIWNGAARTIVTGLIGGVAELSVDSNGIFNVILGTIPDPSPMPEFIEDNYYLQITVAGTPLVPRQRLVATPFAITARNVRGLDGGTVIVTGSQTNPLINSWNSTGRAVQGSYGILTSPRLGVLGHPDGYGVFGSVPQRSDIGVRGENRLVSGSGMGIGVEGEGDIGMHGMGVSAGGSFESESGPGVFAQTAASNRPAVRAINTSSGSGVHAESRGGNHGVWGTSTGTGSGNGVFGFTTGNGLRSGVAGLNASTAPTAGPGMLGLGPNFGVAGAGARVGILGIAADSLGALADSVSSLGLYGITGVGVYGSGDVGVRGRGTTSAGGWFQGDQQYAIYALKINDIDNDGFPAIYARNEEESFDSSRMNPGVEGFSQAGLGIYGRSEWYEGIRGYSFSGHGVVGLANGAEYPARFIDANHHYGGLFIGQGDNPGIVGDEGQEDRGLGVYGNAYCNEAWNVSALDIAEWVKVNDPSIEKGDVVVIDPSGTKVVTKSSKAYGTSVAGIISTDPGYLGGGILQGMDIINRNEMQEKGYRMLALCGQVPCKVSDENGAIAVGDLLTTSNTPGHAMKVTDKIAALGAIVGKAMEPLASGKGIITVLVTLQ
jgi:hypothetical protein